jgi:hypothetical protein
VGKGKLVVSSADISAEMNDRPAARQLYYSLVRYMTSAKFNPVNSISLELINDIFKTPSREQVNMYTKESPDELKPNSNQPKN